MVCVKTTGLNTLAPIVLFVYNRPDHTRQTLEALAKNDLADQSILYIYADGPKEQASEVQLQKIKTTRELIKQNKWCKEVYIIESEKNKGLADSVIFGVTEVVNKYGTVIVLEDDLVTATNFLLYMNKALELFRNKENVMQISGHFFPLATIKPKNTSFFLPLTTSWGWATWKRAWDKFDSEASGYEKLKTDNKLAHRFDLDGSYPYTAMMIDQMERKTINSWAIRWYWATFKNGGLGLFPDCSMVQNIGFDSEGTHTKAGNAAIEHLFDSEYQIIHFPYRIKNQTVIFKHLKHHLNSKIPSRDLILAIKIKLRELLRRLF